MSEWKTVELINACHKITDGAHKSPPTVTNGYPMASVKDMTYTGIDLSNCRKISRKDYLELVSNDCKPQINDVLIAKDGSYLKHIVLVTEEQEVVLLSSIAIIRPNMDVISPKFLKYIFLNPSFRDTVEGNFVTGAVIPRIVLKDFKQIEILLPPLPEQKAIAAVLSSLDDKIDLLHRQNKTLEAMAETLFRQWFVEEADEGWEVQPLGNLVTVKRGGSPRPIQDYLSETGLRWLKISDATKEDSPYIFEIKEHIKESGLNKTTLLEKGTLVLSNSATPGIPKILQVDSCIHDGWLHFPKSYFSKEFLYLLFKSIREELVSYGNGSIFTNLKTDILKDYRIPIPEKTQLQDFQRSVELMFKKILHNANQIRTLEKLRDTLLPKLMSDEVRVKV